ncbi:MAG: polysaccharide pyruvyl transferase family protein [Selenomonadaceae bacterium]|nr:polysaccharide pyruvyl transferase family protein [Selenomonadaceae bacterium]
MRIGIITMHRVLNCGSALQAYALQRKLRDMGYDNEIIDYKYLDKSASEPSLKARVTTFLREALFGFPVERMKYKFKAFYKHNLVLSERAYDREGLAKNPPRYDLYLAGSDQIWNPRFIGDDVNFLLAFAAPDARRISYASSIASTVMDVRMKGLYSTHLSRFQAISVRERSGVGIIKELTGKDAAVCCDPTLLLGRNEWDGLASQSQYRIDGKYILVYALSYMFDPFPEIYGIVDRVQQALGMKVVFLQGRAKDVFRPDSKLIKSAGPADFAYLFKHASFVITTSFHGASFALIYDKPLIGVVDSRSGLDSRIQSLLESVSAADSIYDYRDTPNLDSAGLLSLKGNRDALDRLVQASTVYLKDNL